MDKQWLKSKTTVEECEKNNLVEDERLGPDPVTFGFMHWEWLDLKCQIEKGDELWKFSSPPEMWEHLCGRAGICIIRNGVIVNSIVTVIN